MSGVASTNSGSSHPATCHEYDTDPAGFHAAPNPPAYDKGEAQSTLCSAKVLTGNTTLILKTQVITVTAAMANTTLFRTLTVAPLSPTLAIMGAEDCIPSLICRMLAYLVATYLLVMHNPQHP
jgi:hypothetical protein